MRALSILALLPFVAAVAAAAQSAPAQPVPAPQFNPAAPMHDSRTDLPAISQAQPAPQQLRAMVVVKTLAKNDSVCYTVRSYQYTADAEAPKPSGQTTCQPARNTSALIVVQPK